MKEQLYIKKGKSYKPVEPYFNVDDTILMFCAFRYALGRRSYVVGTVIEALISAANRGMVKVEKDKYIKEIKEYYDTNKSLGDTWDTEDWLYLAAYLDETNSYSLEANYHNTDRWEKVDNAFLFENEYCARGINSNSKRSNYHTVRNVNKNETL